MDLSDDEKLQLAGLVDSSLHQAILDEVLSNLSDSDKRQFLVYLHTNADEDKILEFLGSRIEGIEERIKKVSDQLVQKIHQDIEESKRVREKNQHG